MLKYELVKFKRTYLHSTKRYRYIRIIYWMTLVYRRLVQNIDHFWFLDLLNNEWLTTRSNWFPPPWFLMIYLRKLPYLFFLRWGQNWYLSAVVSPWPADYRQRGRCQQLRPGPLHRRPGNRRPGPRSYPENRRWMYRAAGFSGVP